MHVRVDKSKSEIYQNENGGIMGAFYFLLHCFLFFYNAQKFAFSSIDLHLMCQVRNDTRQVQRIITPCGVCALLPLKKPKAFHILDYL